MDYNLKELLAEETGFELLVGTEESLEAIIKDIEEIDGDTNLANVENSSLCILMEWANSLLEDELILEELLAKDVVGLVVYSSDIPQSFIDKARICRIPIVSAAGVKNQDWLNYLKRNLETSAIDLMEHNIKMQQVFQNILLDDGGFKTICSTLSDYISNPVLIMDRFKEDIIYLDRQLRDKREKYFNMDQRKLVNIEEVYNRYNYQINRVIYAVQDSEEQELHIKIGKTKDTLAYLVIVEENELFREHDFISIIQAANVLALKLNFNRFVQTLARKTCNELIKELLEGKNQDKEAIIKRGELAGWDLTLPYQLYLFRFKDYYEFHEKEEGEEVYFFFDYQEKVIRYLHRIMKSQFPYRYIIFEYQDDILLLVNIHHQDQLEEIRYEISDVVKKELESKFKKLEFYVGAGRYYHNCLEIRKSYQESLKALTVIRYGNTDDILFFEDLGILQLLWEVDHSHLINFTDESLKDLIEYERDSQTDLINTLGAYLASDCKIQGTADKLHVHPNTVSYRIKRINEILGCDLKDFETRINLSIAYKIYKFVSEGDSEFINEEVN